MDTNQQQYIIKTYDHTRQEYETTVAQQEAQMFFAINEIKYAIGTASPKDLEFIVKELDLILSRKGYTINEMDRETKTKVNLLHLENW